jgi:hypothetical protein
MPLFPSQKRKRKGPAKVREEKRIVVRIVHRYASTYDTYGLATMQRDAEHTAHG